MKNLIICLLLFASSFTYGFTGQVVSIADGDTVLAEEPSPDIQELTEKAVQGNADAQYSLGRCYLEGEGVEQDYKQAVIWYTRASEQGHHNDVPPHASPRFMLGFVLSQPSEVTAVAPRPTAGI